MRRLRCLLVAVAMSASLVVAAGCSSPEPGTPAPFGEPSPFTPGFGQPTPLP